MSDLILSILGALRSGLRTRAELTIENLALRQQLANLRRTSGRPRLRNSDRAFWLVLSRFWSRWADVLVVVKPDTVVRWHRAGFRLFWRWKSRAGDPSDGGVARRPNGSFARWPMPTWAGARPEFTANC
jgi:putative transposase